MLDTETTTTVEDLRANPNLEDSPAELVEEIATGILQGDSNTVIKDQLDAALCKLIDDRIAAALANR